MPSICLKWDVIMGQYKKQWTSYKYKKKAQMWMYGTVYEVCSKVPGLNVEPFFKIM